MSGSFYNPAPGQGASPLEQFGASWVQDSGLARNAEEALQVFQRFGALGPAPVAGYNALRDEALRPFLVEHSDSLHMFRESRSPEESVFIQDRVKQLKAREQYLTEGGAFWTRMAAGLVSPEAIATLPVGAGRLGAATRLGRIGRAAGREAALNAGLTVAEDLGEAGGLPDSIAPDLLGDVALSALFGAALGGVAGAVTGRSIDAAARRHAAVHDAADGLRTPGVEAEAVPQMTTGRSAFVGPDGQSVPQLTPEGIDALSAGLKHLAGPEAGLYVGDLGQTTANAIAFGPLVRMSFDLTDDVAPNAMRHEAIHSLVNLGKLTDADMAVLADAAERGGWAAKHDIEGRYAHSYHQQGEAGRATLLVEEAIADEFAAWRRGEASADGLVGRIFETMREFFDGLRNWLQGRGFETADSLFQKIEAGEIGRRAQGTAPTRGPMDPVEAFERMEDYAGQPGRPIFTTGEQLVAHLTQDAGPMAQMPGALAPAAAAAAELARRAARVGLSDDPVDPLSQRLAQGSGARLITWSQMSYYVMKNNPFQGAAGNAVAKWASEIVQDPGLRMEGVNASTSVEALTKQSGWRFHQVSQAMDRLYYQHAGWDPTAATPARSRLEEARQRLPGKLGAVPDGKLTMQEFNDATFRAIAGETNPAWPAEVAEAAATWRRDFLDPYERELAEHGVILSGKYKAESMAAVGSEMAGYERRAKALEARIADPAIPEEVRDRLQSLYEREVGGFNRAKERFDGIADMEVSNEPYVFHNWLKGKAAKERPRLVDILATHWNKERPRGSWAPGHVRAEIAVSHLLGDSIPETLEKAIARQRMLDGEAPDMAAAAAASAAQPVRDLIAQYAPDRLGVEIRSALAWRKEHGPTPGLWDEVKDVLESHGMDTETHEGKLIREIVGPENASAPGDFGDYSRPGHAKERTIDVPTRLIADFLDPSLKQGGAEYARRMSAAIEMARKFGDPSMLGRTNAMEAMLLGEVAAGRGTLEQMDAQLEAARAKRDVVLGQYRIPEDPSAISIRVLRGLSNAAVVAQMGAALWSNIADAGRIMMAHGMMNTLGAAYQAAVVNRAAWRLAGDEAAKAGAALEMTLLGRQRELQQLHDIAADASLAEKLLDQGAKAMGFVNLVAPWTEMAQRFSGALHQSEMIELSVKAAAGTLDDAGRTRLNAYGIDDRMAKAVAGAWTAAGAERADALHLANTDAWADKGLARAFRAQLTTAIDASVMKPGAADRPNFMSAQMWQTMLLYKGFGIASTQRMVMAGLQQRDGRVLSGMMASASIAWLIQGAAAGPYDDHPILSPERLFHAIDRSGVLGIIGDLNNAVETGSANALGLRPLLQLDPPTYLKDPTWAQRVGSVTGPAISPWLSVVAAFTDPDLTGDQRAGALRRTVPFGNTLWLDSSLRAVSREVGTGVDWLMDDGAGRRRAIDLP